MMEMTNSTQKIQKFITTKNTEIHHNLQKIQKSIKMRKSGTSDNSTNNMTYKPSQQPIKNPSTTYHNNENARIN